MRFKQLLACTFALSLTACATTDNPLTHKVNILEERVTALESEVAALKIKQDATDKAVTTLSAQTKENDQRISNVSKTFKK